MDSKMMVLGALALAVLAAGCLGSGNSTSYGQSSGRGVFAVSDPSADMGSVTKVQMTVQDVQVHSQAQGWVTASSTPQTVDLLALNANAKQQLLADSQLAADSYDQMRLDVSSVVVTDAQGDHDAKLPSGKLELSSQMNVKEKESSAAVFDFFARDSLHVTGNGKYVMTPVMHVQTRDSAQVQVNSDNSVTLTGGTVRTDEDVGMDVHGNVGVGVKVPVGVQVDIDANGVISIGSLAGNSSVTGALGGGLYGTYG